MKNLFHFIFNFTIINIFLMVRIYSYNTSVQDIKSREILKNKKDKKQSVCYSQPIPQCFFGLAAIIF